MSTRDHFRIGSITKTFTATVILELVDRGELALDQPISRWEPQIPGAKQITIRMLLDMRSGIWDEGGPGPTGLSLLSRWFGAHCVRQQSKTCRHYWKPQKIVDLAIQQGQAAYPPGTFYYSDTNYVILGIIAHRVTGKPFGWLVKHLVLDPLHLRHTSFPTHTTTLPTPATTGHVGVTVGTSELYQVVGVPSPSTFFGAGNMVSTLADLRVWARALGTGALLKPATQRLRLRLASIGGEMVPLPQIAPINGLPTNGLAPTGLPLSYGLGIAGAGDMLGHNGVLGFPGYTAEMWYLPNVGGTLVVLLNSFTTCTGGYLLSDAATASLSRVAFGSAVRGTALPEFPGLSCPAVAASGG
jgi:D-alanyl-D-alanine carboxypeptidase